MILAVTVLKYLENYSLGNGEFLKTAVSCTIIGKDK